MIAILAHPTLLTSSLYKQELILVAFSSGWNRKQLWLCSPEGLKSPIFCHYISSFWTHTPQPLRPPDIKRHAKNHITTTVLKTDAIVAYNIWLWWPDITVLNDVNSCSGNNTLLSFENIAVSGMFPLPYTHSSFSRSLGFHPLLCLHHQHVLCHNYRYHFHIYVFFCPISRFVIYNAQYIFFYYYYLLIQNWNRSHW